MEKNKFFTFIFSFIPGTGHMYLGMMKKGVFLMLSFMVASMLSASIGMNFLICILPVIWFYTFFDTFHMARMNYDTRQEIDHAFYEKLIFFCDGDFATFITRKRKLVGCILIFLAIYALIYGAMLPILNWFDYEYSLLWGVMRFLRIVPTLIIILALFFLGKKMLKDEEQEFVEYKSESSEQGIPEEKTDTACVDLTKDNH